MKEGVEEQLHQLRSKATELLYREDWEQYINLYTHFISLCSHHLSQDPESSTNLQKSLSVALSNCAEARYKLRDLSSALRDYNQALEIDPIHLKSLICKGKVLLDLDRYAPAHECIQRALSVNKSEALVELLYRFDAQSRTGQIDLSDWLLNGFNGGPQSLQSM